MKTISRISLLFTLILFFSALSCSAATDAKVFTSKAEAREYLENQIVRGETRVDLLTSSPDWSLYREVRSLDDNKYSQEEPPEALGDYINQMAITSIREGIVSKEGSAYKRSYYIVPTLTREQAAYVADRVRKAAFCVKGMSDRGKALMITRWICDHLTYEVTNVRNMYDPLVTGKGQCMHYAQLFYLIGKEAGLEVRVVVCHIPDGSLHELDIVKIDGRWYYIDPTAAEKASRLSEWAFLGQKSMKHLRLKPGSREYITSVVEEEDLCYGER